MTVATNQILDTNKGRHPMVGTWPIAASTRLLKGWSVARDASGNLVAPTDGDGLPVVGVSQADYDNSAGSAGDVDAQVDYGVFERSYTGTAPVATQVVYSVNNYTVSTDSDGGARGIAGIVTEVRNSKAFVLTGPDVIALLSRQDSGSINVPLGSLRLSTGAAVPTFSDGVADGFALVDSEALGLRINDDSTTTFVVTVPMPANLDDTQDLTLHLLGFRVGALDVTAAVTVGAFFHTVGAAHTADADAGGATSAFGAATTIVTDATRTIAAADVPAAPCDLTLTFTVTAALDADDLVLTSCWIEYQSK
jgi:hypothetical protein